MQNKYISAQTLAQTSHHEPKINLKGAINLKVKTGNYKTLEANIK